MPTDATLGPGCSRSSRSDVVRGDILDDRHAHRRPRHQDRPPDRRRGRHPAARARLGAVHPRRDAGAGASPRSAPARTSRSSTRSQGEYREHFMLHYNFPPYSVGEAGRIGSPGPARDRPRQAGLARAPPAAARARTSSPTRSASCPRSPNRNGSSSMATVCGGSLSLMDAGVPLKRARSPASPWA